MAENNRMAVGGNIMPSPSKPMAPEQSDGSGSEGSDAIPSKPMAPDQSDGSESKGSDAIPILSVAFFNEFICTIHLTMKTIKRLIFPDMIGKHASKIGHPQPCHGFNKAMIVPASFL